MAEIKLDWDLDPIERLKVEIENEKDENAKIIGNQLLKDFESDEKLRDCYKSKKISLSEVWKAIMDRAQKIAKSNSCCVKDDDVYSWARQFILDGKIQEKTDAELLINVATKEELIKQAEEEFKKKEMARLEEEKAKKQNELIDAEKKKKELQAKKEKEKIEKLKEEGQISLW